MAKERHPRCPNVPLKAPPHSDEAEQAVLGGLMLDDGAWFDITEIVSASDFYRPQHQLIFDAMQALMNDLKPLDALTVSSQLESSGHLTKMGDNAYLAYLVDRTPGTSKRCGPTPASCANRRTSADSSGR